MPYKLTGMPYKLTGMPYKLTGMPYRGGRMGRTQGAFDNGITI
ncbi:hypothetical protein AGMMS49942_23490 [Spirochaetia bacterium]|nr:hypothetical protein AGMMS49942_23490 [Spirochaetia bacterium]